MAAAPLLPEVLPPFVSTAEVDLAGGESFELLPEEATSLPRASPDRLREFAAGRHCARLALERFGVHRSPVLRAGDRSPVWPDGFVGSISHTRRKEFGYCAAAVARRGDLRALGVDAELDSPLEAELWARVMTPGELTRLGQSPEDARGFQAKLLFSAKESFYKCQYTLSGQFLEFGDVEVNLDLDGFRFEAIIGRAAPPFPAGSAFSGRFIRRSGVIVTAVTLV